MRPLVLSVTTLILTTGIAAAEPLKLSTGQLAQVWGGVSIGNGNGNGNGNIGNGNGNDNSGNDNGNGNVGSGNGNGNSGNNNGNSNFGNSNGNGNATSGNGNGIVGNGQGNAAPASPNASVSNSIASVSNSVAMTSAPVMPPSVSGFSAARGVQGVGNGAASGIFTGTGVPSNFGSLSQSLSATAPGGAFSLMQGSIPAVSGAGSIR
jgi:hypothetical protein